MVQHNQGLPNSAMGQTGLCAGMTPPSDSWSLVENSTTSSTSNGTVSDIQGSLAALSADSKNIDSDELINKLKMVVRENLELKETITQNNMALRQQLGLVARWGQQCEMHQSQQREKMADTAQQLMILQREYDLMKARDSAKVGLVSESQKEINTVVDKLKQQLEHSETSLMKATTEINNFGVIKSKLETDITLLKRDLTIAKGEQERLLLERFEHMTNISELREQTRLLRAGIVPLKESPTTSEYEGLGESMSDIEVQKLKNDLKNEQDTTATLLQELHDTRAQVDKVHLELDRVNKELAVQKRHPQAHNTPVTSTGDKKTELSSAENKRLRDEAAMLRDEVDTLEAALSEERMKLSEERAALIRSHTEVAKLKKELTEVRGETSHNTDRYYENKIKMLNEQYDGVTAKLISYEELLLAKNEEISKLKKDLGQSKAKLSEVSSEGETIAVLRAQVEVYHADFKAEREAREAIANDREKLRDELRHLHQRNTQLVDELEAYQRRHFDQRSGSEEPVRSSAQESASGTADGSLASPDFLWERISGGSDKKEEDSKKKEAPPELDENLFYCPKCNKSFGELRPLEEHVNRCLDEDL